VAIAKAQAQPPEYAVVDLKMPGESGLVLIEKLIELDPNTRIVMLTGYASIATAIEAIKLGAIHYLAKPCDADEVVAALNKKQRWRLGDSGRRFAAVGRSPRMGTYPARAGRASGQYLGNRESLENAPPHAAAQARQTSGQGVAMTGTGQRPGHHPERPRVGR
jgi:DNA-binding NtrC family response regulator